MILIGVLIAVAIFVFFKVWKGIQDANDEEARIAQRNFEDKRRKLRPRITKHGR